MDADLIKLLTNAGDYIKNKIMTERSLSIESFFNHASSSSCLSSTSSVIVLVPILDIVWKMSTRTTTRARGSRAH